jgi:hypothetical protein
MLRHGCIKERKMADINGKWEFDPESIGKNDLKRLGINTEKDWEEYQKYANAVVNPRTDIPDYYRGHVKNLRDKWRMNINPSLLADEQLFEVDQHLIETYFAQNPMADMLARYGSQRAQKVPAWTSKTYKVESEKFPSFVKGTASGFRNAVSFKLGVEPSQIDGIGAAVKIDLPWTLLAEGREGVYDPEFWHNKKAMEKFGVFWDERMCLGTAGENTSGDLGVKGVHNYTSLPTFEGGAGEDEDMTAAGDMDFTIIAALGDLMTTYEPGYNILITTSGVATEILMHDSAGTDRTEYERLYNKWFKSGIISEWIVDNNIEANANAVATGRMQILRVGPDCVMREVIYPFQKKPNMNKEFADDVAFTYLTADIYKMYNVACGTIVAADMTTSHAGVVQNGVFMTGGRPPAAMPQAATAIRPKFYPTQGL